MVQVFDADVCAGGTTTEGTTGDAGRDRLRTNTGADANTTCNYQLFNPAGTQQGSTVTLGSANTSVGLVATTADNSWQTIHRSGTTPLALNNPAAGHWRLVVDMQGGNDLNGFGVRAFNGTGNEGASGTELNIYAPSFTPYGVNPIANPSNTVTTDHPYVSSGCNCSHRDFDFDNGNGTGPWGSTTYTGLNGFTATQSGPSGDDTWTALAIAGWSDFNLGGQPAGSASRGYGIWTRATTIRTYVTGAGTNGNYGVTYLGAFNVSGTNAPTASPQANTFRAYMRTDAGAAPVKPHARQYIRNVVSGPNPPVSGQTSVIEIQAEITNPTAFPITFSGTNLVTARIPSPRVTYVGSSATVSQNSGGLTQPGNGTNNVNLTWNPGTLAAGATGWMRYRVNLTPTAANQTTNITGTPAANGTTFTYIDETGPSLTGAALTRATYTFGPLCQLAVTTNNSTLSVDLLSYKATSEGVGQPVLLEWETANEWDNSGFVVRGSDIEPATGELILGPELKFVASRTNGVGGAKYSWTDTTVMRDGESRAYFLEDIDLSGKKTAHGPIWVNGSLTDSTATIGDWSSY